MLETRIHKCTILFNVLQLLSTVITLTSDWIESKLFRSTTLVCSTGDRASSHC